MSSLTLDESHVGAISVISQDHNGFIWIGGEDGIARYDGRHFRIYKHNIKDSESISDNRVLDIAFDQQNKMWVATGRGLNMYDESSDSFRQYLSEHREENWMPTNYITQLTVAEDNSLILGTGSGLSIFNPQRTAFTNHPIQFSKSGEILTLFLDKKDVVWMGAAGGLGAFDLHTQEVTTFENKKSEGNLLDVYSLFEDSRGYLWIGTLGKGLSRLNRERNEFTFFDNVEGKVNEGVVSSITELANGNIVATYDGKGLLIFDTVKQSFSFAQHDQADPYSVSSNQLEYAFIDEQKNLWLGAFNGVISILSNTSNEFTNFVNTNSKKIDSLIANSVLTIEQTKDGLIWIGTEGGLSVYDPLNESFHNYQADSSKSYSLAANPVLSLSKDQHDNLFVGTWSGGLHYFDREQERFYNFSSTSPYRITEEVTGAASLYKNLTIDDKYIWALHTTPKHLWIGTQRAGLRSYDFSKHKLEQYTAVPDDPSTISWDFVRDITDAEDNKLWIATVNGLNHFDPETEIFTRYFNIPENPQSLSAVGCIALLRHSNGTLWVGTEGGGINVFNPKTQRFERINQTSGLPSMTISTMIEDENGYVWAGSLNGLIKVHPNDRGDISIFKNQDGLVTNFFNRNAILKSQKGYIYIGGVGGVSKFSPKTLKKLQPQVSVAITQFKVHHKIIPAGNAPLTTAAHLSESITLPYKANAFSFNFSILDYSGSSLNEFAYRLKGYNDDWIFVGRENNANYTNLDPGRYVFQVKGVSSDKKWSTTVKNLEVIIQTPPWLSWWAYASYLVIGLATLYLLYITQHHRIELRKQTELNKNLVEIDHLKDSFLANTTHELRTPLNGIIGICEYLISSVAIGRNPHDLLQKLEIISLSGKRLSSLVNDILDCSKLQANKLELIKSEFSLYYTVENIFHIVKYLVSGKNLTLINKVPKDLPRIFADENRIEQVLLNLVSNAIKYTDKGTIQVGASYDSEKIEIYIRDTGIGVKQDQIDKMFIPYAQIASAGERRKGGTGLGIPLAKAIIELHEGELKVNSEIGQGSTFTFSLPNLLHFNNNAKNAAKTGDDIDGSGYRALVVDDDMVNRMILSQMLQKMSFTVNEAKSGMEVLESIQKYKFDLIILDIYMRDIGGIETCRRLRQEYKLEIPILFLSGNDSSQDLNSCLDAGGDALMSKPISYERLKNSLLEYFGEKDEATINKNN